LYSQALNSFREFNNSKEPVMIKKIILAVLTVVSLNVFADAAVTETITSGETTTTVKSPQNSAISPAVTVITSDVKDARKYTDDTIRDVNRDMVRNQKETSAEIKALRSDVDDKIRKALDNPLSK